MLGQRLGASTAAPLSAAQSAFGSPVQPFVTDNAAFAHQRREWMASPTLPKTSVQLRTSTSSRPASMEPRPILLIA